MTLREAARVLGISKEAVRKRVSRGTLAHEKGEDGRVYVSLPEGDVYMPAGGDEGTDAAGDAGGDAGTDDHGNRRVPDRDDQPDDRDELIAELRAEVAAWREESRRKDHIIAALVERLPLQIEAPKDAPQAPETAREDAGGVGDRPAPAKAQDGTRVSSSPRRPWWRRLLGGWTWG